MDFQKIDMAGDANQRNKVLQAEISKGNYNGAVRGDGKGWSATDIVTQFRSSASAPLASCIVGGVAPSGKIISRVSMMDTLIVKLKVLSRQACYKDAKGKLLDSDPTSKKQIKSDAEPVEGDVVRIDQGPQLVNQMTGAALTVYERNQKIAAGESLNAFEYAEVDENGCIQVALRDAMAMLGKNGFRIAFPEHNLAHSSIKDTDEGQKRRITNWLFEEVAAEYGQKPKQKRAPRQPKAEPTTTVEK